MTSNVKNNDQMKMWSADFGKSYTDRNPKNIAEMDELYIKNFGITRTQLNIEFLNHLNRDIKILEVGSNVGAQLTGLQQLGFSKLYGIELQPYAVELSKKNTTNINLICGSAFDIPFKNNYFDLVFTSGVLIHLSPITIEKALEEIYRCSNKLIWGYEYFSEKFQEISYRGNSELMWKNNFSKLYHDKFSDLVVTKEKKIKYLDSNSVDAMFMLEKTTV